MAEYRFRPAPSGLHAKMLREARELSPYFVLQSADGRHGRVIVFKHGVVGPLWNGHRDLLPAKYRFANDPHGVLKRPDSSD